MAYRLTLTTDDIRTINFAGHRYGWSDALIRADVVAGRNELEEWQAWEWQEAAEDDGAPHVFPLLMADCPLADKLRALYLAII